MDLEGLSHSSLTEALDMRPFEARQLALRGGFQLLRIAGEEESQREVRRLAAAGLKVVTITESDVWAASLPRVALGGEQREGAFELRSEEGVVRLEGRDLLLIVRGPIVREYQSRPKPRRVGLATLEHGYRIHLHLAGDRRPVELDPGAFDFGLLPLASSSLLLINDWMRDFGRGVAEDDAFRYLPPALGLSVPDSGTSFDPRTALPRPSGHDRDQQAPPILDNLAQFRFYSAWRGTLERTRGG